MQSVQDILNTKKQTEEVRQINRAGKKLMIFRTIKQIFYFSVAILFFYSALFLWEKPVQIADLAAADILIAEGGGLELKRSGQITKIPEQYEIQSGDVLITSSVTIAELYLAGGGVMRLDKSSQLKVLTVNPTIFGRAIDVKVENGRVWIHNQIHRNKLRVASEFVLVDSSSASFGFQYLPDKKKVEIFVDRAGVLISFLSKANSFDSILNQILLPENNRILISELSITEHFLEAKYLKLLKNVKMEIYKPTATDWYVYHMEKDRALIEKVGILAVLKADNQVRLSTQSIDDKGFLQSLEEKLIFFPQKKLHSLKGDTLSLLKAAYISLSKGDLGSGKVLLEQFKNSYSALMQSDIETAAKEEIFSQITAVYFSLFSAASSDPLYELKNDLRLFLADNISDANEKARFLALELRDPLYDAYQVMDSNNPLRTSAAKAFLEKYQTLLNDKRIQTLLAKIEGGSQYLIRERHFLINILLQYPELYDPDLFKIVAVLEDLITQWSPKVVDEDDNRLFFRAQNLELFSSLVEALKNNQGNRYHIIELGNYLNERNQNLIPPKINVEDNPSYLKKQEEFFSLMDYINSDYFKGAYSDADYQVYLKYQEYLDKYTNSPNKIRRKTATVSVQNQIAQVKKDFGRYGYKVGEIKSLGDSRLILFDIVSVLVQGKTIKGKYNLEGTFMYDIVVDSELKKSEVHLSLLPEVLVKSSVPDDDKPAAEESDDTLSPVERLILLDLVEKLAKYDLTVATIDDIEIVNFDKSIFMIEKSIYTKSADIELKFRFYDNVVEADSMEVRLTSGAYAKISGRGPLTEMIKKAYEQYELSKGEGG